MIDKARRPRRPKKAALPALPAPRIPASETDLTAAEGKILKDPNWVTEDEADAIMLRRTEKDNRGRAIPLDEFLEKHGIEMETLGRTARGTAVRNARRRCSV